MPQRNLSLGKVMHAALAQWLIEPTANLYELFEHAAADDLIHIKTNYFKKVGTAISETELENYYDDLALGTAMCKNYQQKYERPIFNGFEIIQPEVEIQVPIPNTSGFLKLRLDGIIKRQRDAALFVLEHKTYNARPRLDKLQMEDQFLAYVWGAEQTGLGYIAGIAYDGMWKRATPTRGSTFDDLFMRVLITRPRYEIENFGYQLAWEYDDMAVARESIRLGASESYLYPNRRWEGCFDCVFEKLCAMQSRGESWQDYKEINFVKLDADKEPVED